ncbi:MAG: DUF4339 domain-containing protein [Ruminococcaceae bacterium]|nr:DUF4339 domain-containing protein [Oscillospiraceae bacterium]
MALFDRNNRKGGHADEIRCDEPNYLIWKWHPSGSQRGENQRENAIRWGSSLRVKDGEVAVFVYKQKDGTMQDFIEGPFDQTIKTANFPILSSIIGLAYEGGTPFQAEVYFINLARIIQVRFGVPFFDVYDPRFEDFGVPVAVRGTISFGIKDYREFVKLHRLFSFNLDEFQKQIRDVVIRYVKDAVTNAPAAHGIPVIQIESKAAIINDAVEYDIQERLNADFGVQVSGVDISAIEIDKQSEGYRQLMAVTKDVTTATMQAEAAARIKNIHDQQRIEAEHYEESLRIQREEGQYAQHMQTRSANIGAYQIEKQTEVGVAGAEALGHMGEHGAGSVDLGDGGGGGTGFNPAAMMVSLAVGGMVGKNIAGAMEAAMTPGAVPPPVPTVAYHVALDGKAAGPFDLATLKSMAMAGTFNGDSLVWKAGMAEWAKASAVAELAEVLGAGMPPIPTV